MRKYIPFLTGPTPAATPTTQKRFDAVFTALNLLLQLAALKCGNQLAAILASMFNRFAIFLHGDAAVLSKQLKRGRAFWVNYLRTNRDGAILHTGADPRSPEFKMGHLHDLIDLRESILDSIASDKLQLFDAIVFALYSFDRLMTFPQVPNYDTITTPQAEAPAGVHDPINMIPEALAELGITPEAFRAEYARRCKSQNHIIMSTAGVNGPASWTAHSDARAIVGNTELYASLQAFAEGSKLTRFISDLLGTVALPSYDNINDSMLRVGKLHSFDEWGGKVRTVAIVDYWTQLIMSPLHDTIFHFLEKLETDGTFNQDALAERIRCFTLDSELEIYSYDLTAATDRLPIALQVRVLAVLLGETLANNWRNVLVNREYYNADGVGYTYACGQPMGAKSSWAMLALTHHVIVQNAALTAGSQPYTGYGVLGDDVTITLSTVASEYKHIMDYYGVAINKSKSIIHIPGARPAAEICKRVFIDGRELSMLPVKLIAKTIMNGRLAPTLQVMMQSRGLTLDHKSLLAWLGGLIDKISLDFLYILNKLPSSLSGIPTPIVESFTDQQMSTWYPGTEAKAKEIISAFTYTAIVEQLKRLDTLLRQTQIIQAAIETNAFGYHTQNIKDLGWCYVDPERDITALANSMPKMNVTHPIVKAATAEVDRVSELLLKLRTGEKDTTAQARARLLDMFRNALVDAWVDADAARAQADRSLLQLSLTRLAELLIGRKAAKPRFTLSFTVMLTYLNRLWTVTWEKDQDVTLNAVKSRVTGTAAMALKNTTELTSINLAEFFPIHVSKIITPADATVPASKPVNLHSESLSVGRRAKSSRKLPPPVGSN
jgi:hypothetical protein